MKVEVIVHPNARRPRIETDLLDTLHVYVKEPPLEGKANKATVDALAEHFSTNKRNVILLSGAKSKNKFFSIGLQ